MSALGHQHDRATHRDLCPRCHGAGGQRILRRWYEGGEPEYESFSIHQSQQTVILDVPKNERVETEPAEHVEALEQLHLPRDQRTVIVCSTCRGTGVA